MSSDRPRVLFATGSPARYMMPPVFSAEQVNCGPDWIDDIAPDGRVRSLKTPVGDYDLAAIASKLPPEQQPDVVVCLVDAAWRNVPRNLAAFRCPRVLLIADTHHLRSPLIGMLQHASSEPYDRKVILYDRHHAAFFHAAGIRGVYWLPGLTFPHSDTIVRAARTTGVRTPRVAFVGQIGTNHPRRTRVLEAITAQGLPLQRRVLRQPEALSFYGKSLLGLNASLNGDLNLRVFEVLASGAALLTDALTDESGLSRLFAAGRELATYQNSSDVCEVAGHYLARPEKARAIGAAGARWFDQNWNEAMRRRAFQSVAFDGAAPALFDFEPNELGRVFFNGNLDRLLQGVMLYEGVQEFHRKQEHVRVWLDRENGLDDFGTMCATLPRVHLVEGATAARVDLAAFGRDGIDRVPERAAHVWCADAEENDFESLATRFASRGLVPASCDVTLFSCTRDAESDDASGTEATTGAACAT